MADVKPVRHLSIYLAKAHVATSAELINWTLCDPPITVPISGYDDGELFVRTMPPHPPEWTKLFESVLNPTKFAAPGFSAAFVLGVKGRFFVLTFGQGGRFLLINDSYEERFGLICALNSVDLHTFRSVDVQSLDAIQSQTRIQSGEATTPDQFGLDVEQDLLKAIVGTPSDSRLGSRMTGHDSLTVSVRADLTDLPYILGEYRKKFETELSAEDYEWVNNISLVKDADQEAILESELSARLTKKDFNSIWLSIPQIIDWKKVVGFTFTRSKGEVHPDINMAGFLKTVDEATTLDATLLKSRDVSCVDEDHKKVFGRWSVYKCLYAEIDIDGAKFILNDGKWFKVDLDFVKRTNTSFKQIPYASISLPLYKGGGESQYNGDVAKKYPDTYALLDDTKKVFHGGGHGQVEVCDLLSIDKQLIHVKLFGKSSVLSHLFAQGFVSGQLIQIDEEFRKKARDKLPTTFKALIPTTKPQPNEFSIVYGVISEEEGEKLNLPFFSRVNLNNTRKILVGFGFKVDLLKIKVDPTFAKTVKLPAKGKAKPI